MINSPTDLSACVIWLDGSNSTYLKSLSTGSGDVTNGSAVGYWQNLGSLSSVGHFTNIGGDSTTRPTYIASLSCLRFSNAQYLTLSATQAYTAQTVFVATSPFAFVDQDRIYSQAASGAADNATYLPLVQTGTSGGVCSYTGAATTARSSTSHRTLSTFDTFTSWHSGGGIRNFRNGESATSFAHTLGTLTALRHRVGASITNTGAAASFYSGDISEVIVYSRALTNAEREDVEYYLSRKWSVLNSIPRQVYALRSGNWSDSTLWSVSADPVPWNFPLEADNVYTNSFTVTADSSTKVDTIRNSANLPNISAGGSFWLANGVSLSANVAGGVAPYTLTLLPAASATLVGRVTAGTLGSANLDIVAVALSGTNHLNLSGDLFASTSNTVAVRLYDTSSMSCIGNINITGGRGIVQTSTNFAYITGNLTALGGNPCMMVANNSKINIVGNVTGGAIGLRGIQCSTIAGGGNSGITIIVRGDVTGGTGSFGIEQGSLGGGITEITGNVYGGNGNVGLSQGSGTIRIIGNIYGTGTGGASIGTSTASVTGDCFATNTGYAINGTSTTVPLSVYGNIINAPNGRQAIYAPRYQVFPTGSAQYTRQAVNGYDSFVDYWTSNATFTYPASSDVAQSVLYSNNTLSGSMIVPPVSSVCLGVPVQLSKGTLVPMTPSSFWNTSINSLSASDSIGMRLKNITTTEAFSAIVKSLVYQ